jgi:hypothetical protein
MRKLILSCVISENVRCSLNISKAHSALIAVVFEFATINTVVITVKRPLISVNKETSVGYGIPRM